METHLISFPLRRLYLREDVRCFNGFAKLKGKIVKAHLEFHNAGQMRCPGDHVCAI
jgi:hypothetical protein